MGCLMWIMLWCSIVCRAAPVPLAQQTSPFGPSTELAAQRGPQIFNAIFDSLRAYGSAMHPNGMSLYVATVPEGVLLHHGNSQASSPFSLDWIAFEIEHAEIFAHQRRFRHHDAISAHSGSQHILFGASETDSGALSSDSEHGWLHTYRTTRPLKLMYIDGMSGNKDDTGVIDSQDYILRNVSLKHRPAVVDSRDKLGPPTPPGELERAQDLCALCSEWGLDGILRTEDPGMEIIKCEFMEGLQELHVSQRKDPKPKLRHMGGGLYGSPGRRLGDRLGSKFSYDYEACFHDIGSSRIAVDYSSMTSAFFFPVNLTNPDKRESALPRLIHSSSESRIAIRNYFAQMAKGQLKRPAEANSAIDWRDTADLIVRRYARRITQLANSTQSSASLSSGLHFLLDAYIDYSVTDPEVRDEQARKQCANFYLQTKRLSTDSDLYINAAFAATTSKICETLFSARHLIGHSSSEDEGVVESVRSSLRHLIDTLNWSVFEDAERLVVPGPSRVP